MKETKVEKVLWVPAWSRGGMVKAVRLAYIDGTLWVAASDVDMALGRAGHGHTISGVPEEHRRKIRISKDDRREGERQLTLNCITVPALRERSQKARKLPAQEKELMLDWVDMLGSVRLFYDDIPVWRFVSTEGWMYHRVRVYKQSYTGSSAKWAWECRSCRTEEVRLDTQEDAYALASEHARKNMVNIA